MKWLTKHVGFLGEFRFKRWLDNHASDVLSEIGVREGQIVLDFGCGSGTYTIPAAKLVGKDGRIYALDISKQSLDKLMTKAKQEELQNIVRVDADGEERIPLDDEAFDIILLIDVLQEIDDKDALFKEVFRILKPKGTVSIFPMHLAEKEVERLASSRNLFLKDRKIRRRVLIFGK